MKDMRDIPPQKTGGYVVSEKKDNRSLEEKNRVFWGNFLGMVVTAVVIFTMTFGDSMRGAIIELIAVSIFMTGFFIGDSDFWKKWPAE